MRFTPVAFESLLQRVEKPGRYIDGEVGVYPVHPQPDLVNFCLAYPDAYEVGMSNLGLKILYNIINAQPELCCADRVYAPWPDMGGLLKEHQLPLFAVQSQAPVKDFDVLGFTLQAEVTYTNILYMLELAGIPLRAVDRGSDDPIVLGGGPCAVNPAPLAPFFDAFFIGEAEEGIVQIAKALSTIKERTARIKALAKIDGVWVPSLGKTPVKAVKYSGFANDDNGLRGQVIPWIQPTHDRLTLEIMRGCGRGCRFCQAGFFYRPLREKNMELLAKALMDEVRNHGWEEAGMMSLSSSDYSCLRPLLQQLAQHLPSLRTNVSLPSLRADTLDEELIALLTELGGSGLTIAPEAGSQRLRDIINKNLSEEDILKAAKICGQTSRKLVKLYFMVGLPGETQEDIEAIVTLVDKILRLGRFNVNITVSPFIPKPFTPFQWEAVATRSYLLEACEYVKRSFKRHRQVKVSYHEIDFSRLEAVLARGDESVADFIEAAYRQGAMFDGWSEYNRRGAWERAAQELGDSHLKWLDAFAIDKPLPWEHIDLGISRDFLLSERERASLAQPTPPCPEHCSNCGICDADTAVQRTPFLKISKPENKPVTDGQANTVRLVYSRIGKLRFVGHLDLLRMFQRLLRASGLPLAYSAGFNPHPIITMCPPASVGVQVMGDFLDFQLTGTVPLSEINEKLDLPEGMKIISLTPRPKKVPAESEMTEIYLVKPPASELPMWPTICDSFNAVAEWPWVRTRKGLNKPGDLKAVVQKMDWTDMGLLLQKRLAGAGVFEILGAVFNATRDGNSEVFRLGFGSTDSTVDWLKVLDFLDE